MPASLTVVLITKNAAHLLERTLGAVSFADSVLVVDSGSTDGTRELAEKLGAEVLLQTDWKGFGHQKGYALSRAKGDWVLMLDADEVVDPVLAEEIRRVVAASGAAAGYAFERVNYFCGERIRYGHSRPAAIERLFRRGKGRVTEQRVHERVVVDGPVERLKGELRHYTSESIAHRIRKNAEYAEVAADEWFRQGKRASLVALACIVPLSLARDLILKGGLLEGRKGVILAGLGAFYSFTKLARLWELERKQVAPVAERRIEE